MNENGFAGLQASDKRLTAEGLELGVRIAELDADLHACRAHSEYLEQRIERLRAVALAADEHLLAADGHLAIRERWLSEALAALQHGDIYV